MNGRDKRCHGLWRISPETRRGSKEARNRRPGAGKFFVTFPRLGATYYAKGESDLRPGKSRGEARPAHYKVTRFAYNLRGQRTRTWGDTDYPVEYEYDSDFGWLTKQHTFRDGLDWDGTSWPTSPGTAGTTTWHYDEATGLLETKEYPDTTKTEYTYYVSRELETRTWARQVGGQDLVTTYTYFDTAGGELKKVDYSDSTPDVEYTYTRWGAQDTVTDAVGTRTFGYTAELELEIEDIDGSGGGLYSFLITRKHQGTGTGEVEGRHAGVSVGTSGTPTADYDATWHYDSSGRFSRVEGPGLPSYGAEYGYLTDSRRVEAVEYKSGASTVVASSTYSPLSNRDLVENVENKAGSTTISQYAYDYNDIGQRKNVVNSGTAFSANAHNKYQYNDRREVTQSKRFLGTDPDNSGSEVTAQSREYQFDNIGNREEHADGGGSPVSYTANQLNQYTAIDTSSPSYDDDGNLTSWDGWDYNWDGENRLKAADDGELEQVSFTYDYMGRRVEATFDDGFSTVTERYVWDGWNLLLVLDGSNNVARKFTWGLDIVEQATGLPAGGRPGAMAGGIGGLLAVEEVSGSESGDYVYFYDANGNVGQVVDWDTETIVGHYEYDPFGRIITSSGDYADINRFRFSTKYQDYITEFNYYGYRYYSPDMGRWLNRDPIRELGGLNVYAFVRNDVINEWDYLGKAYGAITGAAWAIIRAGFIACRELTASKESCENCCNAVAAAGAASLSAAYAADVASCLPLSWFAAPVCIAVSTAVYVAAVDDLVNAANSCMDNCSQKCESS